MANDTIDSLLDETLDDLADLPEFKPYPAGAHHVKIYWALKEVNKIKNFELKMKLVETKELADPSETAPLPGSECSMLFSRENEIGQGKFKKLMMPVFESIGTKSIGEGLKKLEGADVLIVSKTRPDKNDPDKKYMDIIEMALI